LKFGYFATAQSQIQSTANDGVATFW
jgi:hypothetical protein